MRHLSMMLVLAATACSTDAQAPATLPGTAQLAAPVSSPLTPADAEMPNAYIAIEVPGTPCNAHPGFAGEQVFQGGSPGLSRFCRYTGPGTLPLGPTLGHDLAIASTLGIEEAYEGAFAQGFQHNAGALPSTSPALDLPRLILIDTSPTVHPTGSPGTTIGHNPHGHILTNLAIDLICPGGICAAEIGTQLGLELKHTAGGVVADTVNGGDFGSLSQLSRAIEDATREWLMDSTGQPLILNLSLGWLPSWGGHEPTPVAMPPAIQLVYAALLEARCHDVLTFAAAGNTTSGPTDQHGGLMPALWTTRDVTASECTAAIGPGSYSHVDGTPLLLAVGGVTATGDDIGNAREGGRPRLLAYSDHAVATVSTGHTDAMTGTSVSSLVGAAAAASIYRYAPTANGADVITYLEDSGVPRGPVDVDFCAGGVCPPHAMEISVCDATRYACLHESCSIAPPTCLPPLNAYLPHSPSLAAFDTDSDDITPVFGTPHTDPTCGTQDLYSDDAAAAPCPDEQYYGSGAAPMTIPQPAGHFCPACTINVVSGEMMLTHDFEWASSFDSVSVEFKWNDGTKDTYTSTSLPANEDVNWIWAMGLTNLKSATLTAENSGEVATASLALVP